MPVLDTKALIDDRVSAICRLHEAVGNPRAELDLSGGVDSAVMLGLLVRALGPDKITPVYTSIHSSVAQRECARECAAAFGVRLECEDRWLRFYQKGGDGEVDTNPIAMLAKGETYQLARALRVPRSIIDAVPSPDLHGIGAQHSDEDEIRALSGVEWTYSRIDWDSGEYTRVGTIEMLSRFLDRHPQLMQPEPLPEVELDALARAAEPIFKSGVLNGLRLFEYRRSISCPLG